jgi:hypothetical protein
LYCKNGEQSKTLYRIFSLPRGCISPELAAAKTFLDRNSAKSTTLFSSEKKYAVERKKTEQIIFYQNLLYWFFAQYTLMARGFTRTTAAAKLE